MNGNELINGFGNLFFCAFQIQLQSCLVVRCLDSFICTYNIRDSV